MIMKEIWKDIKDFEGLYQVSNLGKVKRIKSIIVDISQGGVRTREIPERLLKQSFVGCGYCSVMLSKKGKVRRFNVHRLVAEAFIPNPSNLPEINHKDENKTNNREDNLEWCTPKYNANYGNRNSLISKLKRENDKKNKLNDYDMNKFLEDLYQ